MKKKWVILFVMLAAGAGYFVYQISGFARGVMDDFHKKGNPDTVNTNSFEVKESK